MTKFTMTDSIRTKIAAQGYCLVRNFLNRDELSHISNIYSELNTSENKNYPVKTVLVSQLPTQLYEKVNVLRSNIFPNIESEIINAVFFSINKLDLANSINSGLHQDHESYYFLGDHKHHLNFYLTIQKEEPKNSNLRLIPSDALLRFDKKFHDLSRGMGASMIVENSYFIQSKDLVYEFSGDINTIVETPELTVGDLLIMRGDIIHGTQNQISNRVALSIRSGQTDILVDKMRYYPTSFNHSHFIKNNVKPYAKRAFLFRHADVDFMTLKELNDLYAKIGSNYTAEIQSAYKKFEIDYIKYLDMYRSHENERKIALSQIMAINS